MVRPAAHAGGKASMQGLGELQMTFKVQPQKKNTEERDVEQGKECAVESKQKPPVHMAIPASSAASSASSSASACAGCGSGSAPAGIGTS